MRFGQGFTGEVGGERQHVVALERRGDAAHDLVLARAFLEVAQLEIEVAFHLAPDDRCHIVDGHTFFAVAAAADGRLVPSIESARTALDVSMAPQAAAISIFERIFSDMTANL